MTIRSIRHHDSLDEVWEDLVYTDARGSQDPNAADLISPITGLLPRLDGVRVGQYGVWRAEIVAQASVAAADDTLDDTVDAIDDGVQRVVDRDRKAVRYTRYFTAAPSLIARMALESELGKVRGWVPSLKSEPETELRHLGDRLETNVTAGDAAVQGRIDAASKRADHRVREIVRLIDDVNAARLALYGLLVTRASERNLPKNWPNRFFRRETKVSEAATPPTK